MVKIKDNGNIAPLMFTLQSYRVELNAKIKYRSAHAYFRIHQESAGIYTAYLISFDGETIQTPPEKVTLLKGARNWTGSTDDEVLLAQLGKVIDTERHQIGKDIN